MAISTDSIQSQADNFITSFQEEGQAIYLEHVKDSVLNGKKSVIIDFADIATFNNDLAVYILQHPKEAIPAFSDAVFTILRGDAGLASYMTNEMHEVFTVRFCNLPDITPQSHVGVSMLGQLFAIEGITVRVSERKNFVKVAVFECANGHRTVVPQDLEQLRKPEHCEQGECEMKKFEFDAERSMFADYQRIKIQEFNEALLPGQLPRGLDIVLQGDLIDSTKPGDRITVTGMLKPIHEKSMGINMNNSRVFTSEIEANYIGVLNKEIGSIEISQEDEAEIRGLAAKPDAYGRLISSIAPAILGYDSVKEAILLQLAGGVPMSFPDGTRRRGDIHLLICGEPGTSKSEMMQFAAKVITRAMFATGKGTSAAGLTAAVVKDKDMLYLEAGILPLCDLSLAVVDEYDKMRQEDRSAMHEALEQQKVIVNKGGFHITLNSRTSVLAALNPVNGIYDSNMPFMENIRLAPPLVSRFDLITLLLDRPNKETDTAIARHILAEHANEGYTASPPVSLDLLKKYIAYARTNIKPILTQEASTVLEEYYLTLRKQSEPGKIPITVRTLESLIRISMARARVLLHDKVSEEDAQVAVNLMGNMLKQVFTSESGQVDTGALVGLSKKDSQMGIAMKAIGTLSKQSSGLFERNVLVDEMKKLGAPDDAIDKLVRMLISNGLIYESAPGRFKAIGYSG